MTYQEERRIKDAAKARKAKKYRYQPAGFDLFDARTSLKPGDVVVKVQPHGCPRNGTMGHCFVGHSETGAFIGLVSESSLTLEKA